MGRERATTSEAVQIRGFGCSDHLPVLAVLENDHEGPGALVAGSGAGRCAAS